MTRNTYGKGSAWYTAARLDDETMKKLFERICTSAGIPICPVPTKGEYYCRETEAVRFHFCLNDSQETLTFQGITGENLLTGENVDGTLLVKPMDGTVVLEKKHKQRF